MSFGKFVRESFRMASSMINAGLDTYIIWGFKSEEDMEDGRWFFKDIFKNYDDACDALEELKALHDDEWFFTTDFESLV